MGAAGAFLIALSRGGLTFKIDFGRAKRSGANNCNIIYDIDWGVGIFISNLAGLPEFLKHFVSEAGVSPFVVMLMIIVIYIILLCF